jgi:hypothetical protein
MPVTASLCSALVPIGAVHYMINRISPQALALAQRNNPRDDTAGRVIGCGRHLVDQGATALGIREHDIRERAADNRR